MLKSDEYEPQPYEQLAAVLAQAGMTDKANLIRYEKFRHRDGATFEDSSWLQNYLFRPALRFIVGYGIYVGWALFWFVGLVSVGFVVAFFSKSHVIESVYQKAWYSLEAALPLVEFSEAHKSIAHGDWRVESYFPMQKVLGFLLATVLVGALTLLPG